jgi:hypothetical protein
MLLVELSNYTAFWTKYYMRGGRIFQIIFVYIGTFHRMVVGFTTLPIIYVCCDTFNILQVILMKNKNQCVGKQLAALGYNKYRLKINNRQA